MGLKARLALPPSISARPTQDGSVGVPTALLGLREKLILLLGPHQEYRPLNENHPTAYVSNLKKNFSMIDGHRRGRALGQKTKDVASQYSRTDVAALWFGTGSLSEQGNI